MQITKQVKTLLVFFLAGSLVFLTVLYFRSQSADSADDVEPQFVSETEDEDIQEESLGEYFVREERSALPPVEDSDASSPECVLEGVLMREGIASGDTVCVSDEPFVTPQSTR